MTWILIVLVAIYALVCVAIFAGQAKLVWFPGPPPQTTPAEHGLAFDDLTLTTSDGVAIHAWHVRTPNARGAIVLCHGNAGNIAARIERARAFAAMGFDSLVFDYRGYGGSAGTPSEEGTYVDADTAWRALVDAGFAPESIVAYGESLGGAVAIELARRRTVGALVVEDTFTSLADMAAKLYWWLPVRWLVRIRYESIAKIGALRVPVLVIHSDEDELVPFAQGQRLYEAAREPKRFLETTGAHNAGGFALRPEWCADVQSFLHQHVHAR